MTPINQLNSVIHTLPKAEQAVLKPQEKKTAAIATQRLTRSTYKKISLDPQKIQPVENSSNSLQKETVEEESDGSTTEAYTYIPEEPTANTLSYTLQADAPEEPIYPAAIEKLLEPADRDEVLAAAEGVEPLFMTTANSSCNLEELPKKLFPRWRFTLGEATYYLTSPLELSYAKAHKLVMALVTIQGHSFRRLYYNSLSHATWRIAPAVKMLNKRITYFDKGFCEDGLNLPIALALALYKKTPIPISDLPDVYKEWLPDRQKLSLNCEVPAEFIKAHKPHVICKNNRSPFFLSQRNHFYFPSSTNPKSVYFTSAQFYPDFSFLAKAKTNKKPTYALTLPHYGEVTAYLIPSKDRTLHYLFYYTKEKQAFLSSVEQVSDSPITSFGIRQQSPVLSGLTTPLLEYRNQISSSKTAGPTTRSSKTRSPYSKNWKQVRKLPSMKEFCQTVRKQKRK